jgi:thioredoxin-related protein
LLADYGTGKKIFQEKCSSCHGKHIDPKILKINFYEKNNELLKLRVPTVNMLAYALKDSPLHVGDKSDPEMQKYEITEFMKDYLYNPNKEDSICDPLISKYYDKKESMKGKISEEEIENIADFLFEYRKYHKKNKKPKNLKVKDINKAFDLAKKENKLVMVEAMSETCHFCKKMYKEVLSKENIQEMISKNYIFLEIDVDKEKLPPILEKNYKKITPSFFVLDKNKNLLNSYPGSWNEEDFKEILKENK